MKPSVGRIVHYVSYGSPGGEFPARACRAAIVTEVGYTGDAVNGSTEHIGIVVFNPTGQWFNRGVSQDESQEMSRAPGTWHWPEIKD